MPNDFAHLDREELAWAAGFFDGEGCVSIRENGKKYLYIKASISQVDTEVLYRFQNAVGGLGNVYGPVEYEGRRPLYYYHIGSWKETQAAICLIWPWLGSIKRSQFIEKMGLFRSQTLPVYLLNKQSNIFPCGTSRDFSYTDEKGKLRCLHCNREKAKNQHRREMSLRAK